MSEATKHTPPPWIYNEGDIWSATLGRPDTPLFQADRQYRRWGRDLNNAERDANAKFACVAVNSHAALFDLAKNVAAFDDSLLVSSNLDLLRATLREFRADARAALVRAT